MGFSYQALMLFSLFLLQNLDAQISCKRDQRIDFVQSEGAHWIECVTPKSFTIIRPNEKIYTIQRKPRVLYFKKKKIFLFDLAQGEKSFLDVLNYTRMKIEGKFDKATRIALSDRRYYRIMDNYPIKLDANNSLSLPSIMSHIDLRSLKYLVLITDRNDSVSIDSIRFLKDHKSIGDQNKTLSVWIWNGKKIDEEFLQHTPIKRVYLQVDRSFEETMGKIHDKEVFGLDGNPKNIFDFTRLKEDIEYLGALKKKNKEIKGFQIDVEPYLIKGFQNHSTQYYRKYLKMLQELSTFAHQKGLLFSVVAPFWFDSVYLDGKPLAYSVVRLADEVALMSYRSKIQKAVDLSKNFLSYADALHTPIKIGMELKKIADERHTIYRQLPSQACLHGGKFYPRCTPLKKIESYTIPGEKISFFKHYKKAKDALHYPIDHPSFSGFILHDYEEIDKLF